MTYTLNSAPLSSSIVLQKPGAESRVHVTWLLYTPYTHQAVSQLPPHWTALWSVCVWVCVYKCMCMWVCGWQAPFIDIRRHFCRHRWRIGRWRPWGDQHAGGDGWAAAGGLPAVLPGQGVGPPLLHPPRRSTAAAAPAAPGPPPQVCISYIKCVCTVLYTICTWNQNVKIKKCISTYSIEAGMEWRICKGYFTEGCQLVYRDSLARFSS